MPQKPNTMMGRGCLLYVRHFSVNWQLVSETSNVVAAPVHFAHIVAHVVAKHGAAARYIAQVTRPDARHACIIQVSRVLLHVVISIVCSAGAIITMTHTLCLIIPTAVACIHSLMTSISHLFSLMVWLLQIGAGCYAAATELLVQKLPIPGFKQQSARVVHAAACNLQHCACNVT